MPRFRLTLEYEGTPFVGWQRQDNGPSVQAAVENAIHRFCGEPAIVVGAGRTDAGVHALGQVAHVDLASDPSPRTLRDAINFHLRPAPIAVLDATSTSEDFHARFSAIERSYRYRIVNRPAPPVLNSGRVWWIRAPLDVSIMNDAALRFVGQHDFTTFRSSMCQSPSAVKTLTELTIRRQGDDVIIDARARSFLHNQVRILVGTLRLVGEHRWSVDRVIAALAARDRKAGGPTAPPQGLFLISVRY